MFGLFTIERDGHESSQRNLTAYLGENIPVDIVRLCRRSLVATSNMLILFLVVLAPVSSRASLIFSGSAEIRGTAQIDLESGDLDSAPPADIWWEQMTATTRQLTPVGGSGVVALGMVDFASVSEADLREFEYTADPIAGPAEGGPSTLLDVGSVFAVRTGDDNYAKVLVTGYDNGIPNRPFYDMHIEFELYDGVVGDVPAASRIGTMLLSLAMLGIGVYFVRRRATH